MLVRPSEYVRPTQGPYAFPLRAVGAGGFDVVTPVPGTRTDVLETQARVMEPEVAARFAQRVHRWDGPQDVDPQGARPYQAQQRVFEQRPWVDRFRFAHVDTVLRGTALVFTDPQGVTDYVLRDHHMLDVVLHHYATTGLLPSSLFHADRHSDWCDDRYLLHRIPPQAATWWALLPGLKRPNGAPVLREQDVHFVTGQADIPGMSGRNLGASIRVPGFLDPAALHFEAALERLSDVKPDWVSLDVDCFQPSPQLRVMRPMVRHARFAELLRHARVRVWVLSPQFTNGGDVHQQWTVQGKLHSTLRVMNLLRSMA